MGLFGERGSLEFHIPTVTCHNAGKMNRKYLSTYFQAIKIADVLFGIFLIPN